MQIKQTDLCFLGRPIIAGIKALLTNTASNGQIPRSRRGKIENNIIIKMNSNIFSSEFFYPDYGSRFMSRSSIVAGGLTTDYSPSMSPNCDDSGLQYIGQVKP